MSEFKNPFVNIFEFFRDFDVYTPVVGEDSDAVSTIVGLTEAIDVLRAYSAGPLTNASEVEALMPLLINLATHKDGLEDVAVPSTDTIETQATYSE